MTDRELRAAEAVIEWAVAPAPPLPPVGQTHAVSALVRSLDRGPRFQRLALRALLMATGPVAGRARDRPDRPARLAWLQTGMLAPVGEALAALAQLAYYGEPAVLVALGCDQAAVRR